MIVIVFRRRSQIVNGVELNDTLPLPLMLLILALYCRTVGAHGVVGVQMRLEGNSDVGSGVGKWRKQDCI